MGKFTDSFKAAVEKDADWLCRLAFEMATSSASPFLVESEVRSSYLLNLNWNHRLNTSKGGVKDGRPFVELALYKALSHGSLTHGYDYTEKAGEGEGFVKLVSRPYFEVLACLIAHEVAHAVTFYAARREPLFGGGDDHGDVWHRMYRYLRANLMFIVSHTSVQSIEQWSEVYQSVLDGLPCLRDELTEGADRTYVNESGIEVEYGDMKSIGLFIENAWNSDRDSDLTLLSNISVELMSEHYTP
ncbi:hypothetical protein [Vibrio sp. R78045]|uniref:hypothetical protein n=1 Tax=Vibrio sp. R78045 TaxID=3093868 RepID=UPI0036F260BD